MAHIKAHIKQSHHRYALVAFSLAEGRVASFHRGSPHMASGFDGRQVCIDCRRSLKKLRRHLWGQKQTPSGRQNLGPEADLRSDFDLRARHEKERLLSSDCGFVSSRGHSCRLLARRCQERSGQVTWRSAANPENYLLRVRHLPRVDDVVGHLAY